MSIQADRQQAKKKQIIDAAMSCFVEKGFHATSTAEICKAAGMSPGNLFHYYPTKSAIIEAIVIDGQVYFEQVLNSIDETNSSIESVSLMMTRLIELYNDPEYARISIEIFAEASRNPDINRIFIENDKKFRDKLTEFIIEGRNKGEIDMKLHPENTASWLISAADGSMGRELTDPEFNWKTKLDAFIYMIKKTLAS